MKLELMCSAKEKDKYYANYYFITFAAGTCVFQINVRKDLAANYEIGKSYSITVGL